jgi:hypothetical protein
MSTIIVHTPQNEHSWNYRYYNIFFKNFIEYLKKKFIVEEDTYFDKANVSYYPVELLNKDTSSYMLECEMIIENKDTSEFVVLSVSDDLTGAILNHHSNPYCKKIIYSQYDEQKLINHIGIQNLKKYSPWIYFPSNLYDINSIRDERNGLTNFIDKFYFRGTSMDDRVILKHFDNNFFEGGLPIGGFETYARNLINYKIALSISGRGEFCYRDVENFGLGVPIIRFEYVNKMYIPLIPDFHYISIDRPDDMTLDRMGNSNHAQLIIDKFLKIKDNHDFLKFISNNARKYYDDYLTMDNSIELTYQILKLYEWE